MWVEGDQHFWYIDPDEKHVKDRHIEVLGSLVKLTSRPDIRIVHIHADKEGRYLVRVLVRYELVKLRLFELGGEDIDGDAEEDESNNIGHMTVTTCGVPPIFMPIVLSGTGP